MKTIVIHLFGLSLLLMAWNAAAQSNVQGQIDRAHALHQRGQLSQASVILTRVLQESLSNAAALLERGTVYRKLGAHRRSVEDLTRYFDGGGKSAEGYYNRGLSYLAQQNNLLALDDFNKAIDINPRHGEAYIQRGLLNNLNNEHKDALEDLNKGLSLKKNSFEGYVYRGVAYYFLNQPGNAVADYNRALRINSRSALAYNNRGLAHMLAGQSNQALKDFDRARALVRPGDRYQVGEEAVLNSAVYYLRKGNVSRALGLVRRSQRQLKDNPKLRLMDAAVDLERGNISTALRKLNRLLKGNSKDPNLRLMRAVAYMRTRKYEQARDDLLVVLRGQPKNTEAHRMLGDAYYNLGQLRNAANQYGEYFEDGGKEATVLSNRAHASYFSGDFTQAVNDYTKLLKNVRGQRAWSYNRGRGNAYFANKDYEKSIPDYEAALKVRNNDREVLLRLSEAYYRQRQYNKALSLLGKGVSSYPRDKAFYKLRARIFEDQEKPKDAIADLERAVKISPDANLFYQLGILYARIENNSRGISRLTRSIRLKRNLAVAYTNRGILYEREKQLNKAKADWERGCKLGDESACKFLQ